MKNRVITISREFGSGGRTIGRKVAEKLGIPCYDSELIQEIEKETGFAADYVKEAGEYAPGGFLASAFSNRMFGPTNEDILWEHQYRVITELAEKSSCVIVGRCADYILAGRDNTINVFVYAPRETRVNRIMARRSLSEAEALKAITTSDKERGNHYFRYTDQKWGKAQNYDICINSALMGIEKTAEMLTAMAKIEVRA